MTNLKSKIAKSFLCCVALAGAMCICQGNENRIPARDYCVEKGYRVIEAGLNDRGLLYYVCEEMPEGYIPQEVTFETLPCVTFYESR